MTGWSPAQIAFHLRTPREEVAHALDGLRALGLVVEDGGRWSRIPRRRVTRGTLAPLHARIAALISSLPNAPTGRRPKSRGPGITIGPASPRTTPHWMGR